MNKNEKISLLFLANHAGRNISNPIWGLFVYLYPIKVSGHFPLQIIKIIPSKKIKPIQYQTSTSTLSNIPA